MLGQVRQAYVSLGIVRTGCHVRPC